MAHGGGVRLRVCASVHRRLGQRRIAAESACRSLTASASHVATPVVVRLPGQASNHAVDVTHAASMMVVGTLLIGIGSMVRRGL